MTNPFGDDRDVWAEIDHLKEELALLRAKKAVLQSHAVELQALAHIIRKNADGIKDIAAELGGLLDG